MERVRVTDRSTSGTASARIGGPGEIFLSDNCPFRHSEPASDREPCRRVSRGAARARRWNVTSWIVNGNSGALLIGPEIVGDALKAHLYKELASVKSESSFRGRRHRG